jgi:FkbM family methyltransferase
MVKMRRNVREFFTRSAIESMRHIPKAIAAIKNWPSFLLSYAGFTNEGMRFEFRDSSVIHTESGVDASTIYVVFFRMDYGIVAGNDVIIDIGANIGAFTFYAASQSPTARIYSYEPTPSNYQILQRNISENSLQNRVIARNIGVAAERGVRRLFLGDGSPYHSIHQVSEGQPFFEMTCCRLQDIFDDNDIGRCNLLKIDCEGAEYEILRGTPATYFDRIDRIRMEYHNQDSPEHNIDDLTRFLETMSFFLVYRDTNALIAWYERRAKQVPSEGT